MPLSKPQGLILRTLAAHRDPESYVSGGTVLNRSGPRISQDIDIFQDREAAVAQAAIRDVETLEALADETGGFDENVPGKPSRWASARSAAWTPLRPQLVVEVSFDQVTDRRLRHGSGFLRWRPDKAPAQCTFAQVES